jgi:hypothetical protein
MKAYHWKILWPCWLNVYSLYLLIPSLTSSGCVSLLWHNVVQTPELHSSQQHFSSRVLKCSLALTFPSQSSVCLSCPIHAACRPAHACHFTIIFHLTLQPLPCETWKSQSCDYEDYCLQDVMLFCLIFRLHFALKDGRICAEDGSHQVALKCYGCLQDYTVSHPRSQYSTSSA